MPAAGLALQQCLRLSFASVFTGHVTSLGSCEVSLHACMPLALINTQSRLLFHLLSVVVFGVFISDLHGVVIDGL